MDTKPTSADVDELLAAVDGLKGYVHDQMRGHLNEVTAVMARIRETVWQYADRFDPTLGTPNTFVFGYARNIVRREISRIRPLDDELPTGDDASSSSQLVDLRTPDPLNVLVSRFNSRRWVRWVCEFTPESDWAVVTELAVDDVDAAAVADRFGISLRSVRTIRERVALTAATVRNALQVVDDGSAPDAVELAACVPDSLGLRDMIAVLGDDVDDVAQRAGIHPGTVRARRAAAKRLLAVASRVIEHEMAS